MLNLHRDKSILPMWPITPIASFTTRSLQQRRLFCFLLCGCRTYPMIHRCFVAEPQHYSSDSAAVSRCPDVIKFTQLQLALIFVITIRRLQLPSVLVNSRRCRLIMYSVVSVCCSVCLSVCLSVCNRQLKISQSLIYRSLPNFWQTLLTYCTRNS